MLATWGIFHLNNTSEEECFSYHSNNCITHSMHTCLSCCLSTKPKACMEICASQGVQVFTNENILLSTSWRWKWRIIEAQWSWKNWNRTLDVLRQIVLEQIVVMCFLLIDQPWIFATFESSFRVTIASITATHKKHLSTTYLFSVNLHCIRWLEHLLIEYYLQAFVLSQQYAKLCNSCEHVYY